MSAGIKFGISRSDRSMGVPISHRKKLPCMKKLQVSFAEFNIPEEDPLGRHDLAVSVMEE